VLISSNWSVSWMEIAILTDFYQYKLGIGISKMW